MNNKLLTKLTVVIIGLVVSIGIAGGYLYITQQPEVSSSQLDASNPNLTKSDDDQYFELVGFGQLEINKDNPYINLINPSENSVYLRFDVVYNDEKIHKTNLIEPGKMEQYDIYSCLDAGEHTITYSIDVYDLKDKQLLWPGIQQEQELIVKN